MNQLNWTHFYVRHIPLNFSQIRQIPLILKRPFFGVYLSITNGIVSSKLYDKWNGFNFETVDFQFLGGEVPRSTSYVVYISELCFARVCFNLGDFSKRHQF